ncbi:hypothetical protein OGAPHI_005552 [Ogataea philodendri]|uniref:Zn(2)-C6 fungal-type domain-containing protein n=1 Tax=Ogataea philodendri TaxID=1378263 RepID=A0A9P8NZD7_9ASCO|nr:uncharacterized protein OGAPHI_005552 [Ogataea philodendri]KAH3662302.1 hypothetical protein OGAPHI_005552 [Ogataea philodendri]
MDSEEVSGVDVTKLRRTTRISKTCLSCKRRKVKCNYEVPCDKCIARNRGHLCSREPIIVDGMVINGGNDALKEMKYSQENEVLKRKIKDLEKTVFTLRSGDPAFQTLQNGSFRANLSISTLDNALAPDSAELSRKWDSYSVVISLLNKGLADGLQDDDDQNFDANTEEWSRITNKELMSKIRRSDDKSDVWNYQLQIIGQLTKPQSDLILQTALKFTFLHNVVDNSKFVREYEEYWNDDSIVEKHITPYYSKHSKEYLFLAQYYMLLCIGVYYSDDTLQPKLGFSDDQWDIYARAFFACGLECLFRGRFMTFPNIKSIQFFSLLKLCAHPLGGIHLQNCLIGTMCYNARKLNLDNVEDNPDDPESQFKYRCWWSLVNVDWYEDQFRYSLIEPGTFSTPRPRQWLVPDAVLDWNNYYQRFVTDVATIKRNYYFDDTVLKSELTLESLKKADIELRVLEITVKKDFENYMDNTRLNQDADFSTTVEFLKFLTDYIILQERLDVNSKLSRFMTYDEWTDQCYELCCNCAKSIISQYADPEVPQLFKKPWFVCELAVSAAVFLLVDALLNKQSAGQQKTVVLLVQKVLPILSSNKLIVRPAIRGIYVIQKLINLMVGNHKSANGFSLSEITKTNSSRLSQSSAPPVTRAPARRSSKFQKTARKQLTFINFSSEPFVPEKQPAQNVPERPYAAPAMPAPQTNTPADQVPQLHEAILDILGDHGWDQFLGSIDDFAMSLDV